MKSIEMENEKVNQENLSCHIRYASYLLYVLCRNGNTAFNYFHGSMA